MKTFSRYLLSAVSILLSATAVNAQTVLRLGNEFPVNHPINENLVAAAKRINDETAGRIEIKIFPASQLGSGRELVQQVSSGALDFGFSGAGMLGNWHRPISVLEAPFLARDWNHWSAMLKSPTAVGILEELERKAAISKIGNACYTGQRHFTTRSRVIQRPDDLRGLKIRVPEVPTFIDMIRAVGAIPTPMPLGDVYLSLQTGVIEGQENPLPTINSAKLQEVQSHIALTGHVISGLWPIANAKTWQRLDRKDREIITRALDMASDSCTRTVLNQERALQKEFEGRGVKFSIPDRDAFIKAMQSVYSKNDEHWGRGVVDALQRTK